MNAAKTFQRFIDKVLRDLPFCFARADDQLIASSDEVLYRQFLHSVFTRLKDYFVYINVDMSEVDVTSLTFLGLTVTL